MQKIKGLLTITTTILLFAIVLGSITLSRSIHTEVDNDLIHFVPETAIYSCRIDAKSMIKETVSNLIISNDEESISTLQQILESEQQTQENPGIDFLNELIIFSYPIKNEFYTCLLFKISNQKKFKKFKDRLLQKNSGAASKDNIGLIILNNHKHQLSTEQLMVQSSTLLNRTPISKKTTTSTTEIQFHLNNGIQDINSIMMPGEIGLNFNKNDILITGSMNVRRIPGYTNYKSIKGDDLLINIPTFSPIISDSIYNILNEFDLGSFHLSGFSVNYKGLTIEEVPGLKLQPEFDALLYFDDLTNSDSLLASVKSLNSEFQMVDNHLKYGKMNYYFHQVNERTIYIGTKKFTSNLIANLDPKVIMQVKGNPKNLTALKGEGMMRKLVELLSLYAASKTFTDSLEAVNYEVIRSKNEEAIINGKLSFKDENSAHLSILRFFLQAKLIR